MPPEVRAALGGERIDFAVATTRAHPRSRAIGNFLFATLWLGFISIFFAVMWGPVFLGDEVRFEANGVPQVAGPGNLRPLLMPTVIVGLFAAVGVAILVGGFWTLFAKGGWFVGTPTRMLVATAKGIRSIDWEQFSGDISVTGKGERGSVFLRLRAPTSIVEDSAGRARGVPDMISIIGVANASSIANICRERIKENDPTPARS